MAFFKTPGPPHQGKQCTWYSSSILPTKGDYIDHMQTYHLLTEVTWEKKCSFTSSAILSETISSWWLSHPFENYDRQIGLFPQAYGRGEENMWNHQLNMIDTYVSTRVH